MSSAIVVPILYPNSETVWYAGDYHNVTWDTSGLPPENTQALALSDSISNVLMLTKEHATSNSTPIASNFSLYAGNVVIQVPFVQPGDDYAFYLIPAGSEGNYGYDFTIDNTTPTTSSFIPASASTTVNVNTTVSVSGSGSGSTINGSGLSTSLTTELSSTTGSFTTLSTSTSTMTTTTNTSSAAALALPPRLRGWIFPMLIALVGTWIGTLS